MRIKERILKYIEFKGISKYKFYQDIGVSNGFLDKSGSVGSDKCEKICYQYPDISLEWLITGKGSMLKTNTYNNVSPPPATPPESNGQIERIYKELLKEKEAENKALNREVGALTKDLEARDAKIMELNAKLSGQAMQIENLQEQLDTATQELEQAVKKSPKPYIMEDIPVGMVAEPEVEYGKK